MSDPIQKIFDYIDKNQDKYVAQLAEWVAIQSVSNELDKREETTQMLQLCKEGLEKLGTICELVPNPANESDPEMNYPPIILGFLGSDESKKTLLVYGHLDVMPAAAEDGWCIDDPFKLEEIDGKLYGRGTTDDKGPVLGWLAIIQAYQQHNMEIPVNLKFCFEAMEEAGGVGLDQVIEDRKDTFFSGIDVVCISDNYWLGKTKPCITYGLRGIIYFTCTIKCAKMELHSGVYGGTIYEAMTDLMHIFAKLVDDSGHILIPGINHTVDTMTLEEEATYNLIEFDPKVFQEDIGAYKLPHEDKARLLQHRWRYPSLSFHGIAGAYSGEGTMTVIPNEVTGKFSIRLVPSQDPDDVEQKVKDYIYKLHAESPSENDIDVKAPTGASAWVSDFTHPNYHCGQNAMKRVYNSDTDLIREGGSIPVILTLQEATGSNVMMLSIGSSDDAAHSQNEKMNRINFINGIKVFGAYLDELGKLAEIPNVKIAKKKYKAHGFKTCNH